MDNIISIKDLSFSYDKTEIFKHLTFDIKKCKWTTIVGLNSSGKTTLVSLINNKYDYSGNISINNKDSKISVDEVLVIDDSFDYEDIYVEFKNVKSFGKYHFDNIENLEINDKNVYVIKKEDKENYNLDNYKITELKKYIIIENREKGD